MKHDLHLPEQMTAENIAKVRRIIAVETYLTDMVQSAGLARSTFPGLVAATREDEHVLLLSDGHHAANAPAPTNLVDFGRLEDGLWEYRFLPKTDEYRG